jgi:MOSC domain-containing protein YiiM
MKLVSINVSPPKTVMHLGEPLTTGIFKQQVPRRVMLRTLNLDGDGQADLSVHGGEDKAAYVYDIAHYDYWQKELKRSDFPFGQFGENFTVEGMTEDRVHIGDVFTVGEAVVEVTQPRLPCFKLAMKMGMPEFPKLFMASKRSGFYLRVLREGEVGAGDAIERIKADSTRMSVRDALHLAYFDRTNLAMAKIAAGIPALSAGWREMFEERLAKADAGVDAGQR